MLAHLGVNALLRVGGHCCSPWLVEPRASGVEGLTLPVDSVGSNIKIGVCCLT